MANWGRDFVYGIQAGSRIGGKIKGAWDERQAGQALADLQAFDPMQLQGEQPAAGAPSAPASGGYQPGGLDAEMPGQDPAQEGAFGAQTSGQPKLPSTRDWITLRQNYLKQSADLGPDAVSKAMDEVDQMQDKGALDNLYIARDLIEQGRDAEAGQYLEAAYSYVPDFGVVTTAPAKLKSGETKLAFEMRDEQTGQPKMPGMIATPAVVDRAIMMIEKRGEYGQARHDRAMAEREWQFEQDKWQGTEQERGWRRDFNVEQERAKYANKRRTTYKPKDYTDMLSDAFDDIAQEIPGVPAQVKQVARIRLSEARKKYPGTDPAKLVGVVIDSLRTEGKIGAKVE